MAVVQGPTTSWAADGFCGVWYDDVTHVAQELRYQNPSQPLPAAVDLYHNGAVVRERTVAAGLALTVHDISAFGVTLVQHTSRGGQTYFGLPLNWALGSRYPF